MLLRCIADQPNLPQGARLGKYFRPGTQEFPVRVGELYRAYGLRLWGAGSWIDIESDGGYLVSVPLCLFEFVDGAVPPTWVARVDAEGDLALLPPAFHEPYFIDDLSEGKTEPRAAFAAAKAEMAAWERARAPGGSGRRS